MVTTDTVRNGRSSWARLQSARCGARGAALFVDNQFGQGAAGQLSFNVMAAMSQYYSENLRDEVLKGMNERAEQGWFPAAAPLGYINDKHDRNEPIKLVATKKATVERIFELYARGNMTFELLSETLLAEGHTYCDSQPRFGRTTLSYILNNRFYIGDITWHGRVFKGKHTPVIDADTFQQCQDILKGRNRCFKELGLLGSSRRAFTPPRRKKLKWSWKRSNSHSARKTM